MIANFITAVQPAAGAPPASSDFMSDVIAGLSSEPRTLPCKYFYDERGAALFQKICELPEYYITRTEIDILDRHRTEIAAHLGAQINLIGLGTGSGTKTRILIDALECLMRELTESEKRMVHDIAKRGAGSKLRT